MGFLKWIRTEIDPTNNKIRNSSKSPITPISKKTFLSETVPDEAYKNALFKFNEWRKQHQFGTLSKKNQKQLEKMTRKLEILKNKKKSDKNQLPFNEFILYDNGLYEEIDRRNLSQSTVKDINKQKQNKRNKDSRHSCPIGNLKNIYTVNESVTNSTIIYQNEIDFGSQSDHVNNDIDNLCTAKEFQYISSPPGKFYRENSSPFDNPIKMSIDTKTKKFIVNKPSLPLYQTVINRNGDEVEYALPLNENVTDECNETNHSIQNNAVIIDRDGENLEMLDEIGLTKTIIESHADKTNFEKLHLKSVIVTDLDKSDENSGNFRAENIMKELETLAKWSQSIDIDVKPENKNNGDDAYLAGVIISSMCEVKINSLNHIKSYGSRIYSGTFRGALISQQKKDDVNISFQDEAILLSYEKLRNLRHPDIALLMGVTTDSIRKINSLILEAFKCSLNTEIHKTDNHIPLNDVIKYTIQLTRAVKYCHENGLIHSNVCSESILLSSYDKKLKISSFELATLCDTVQNIEVNSEKEIPFNFLPHFVNYRKTYSNHCYQSPELITTELKFVYPTKQSDIYGICLTLWEMLNKSIPFSVLNYKDLEKLFYLQNAILPIFEQNRCKEFKYILEKGLQINPENRIESAKNLLILLMEISNLFEQSNIPSSNFSDRIIYDKTSTIKKRKYNEPNLYECTNETNAIPNYSKYEHLSEPCNDDIKLKSNINNKNIFEINDFHLPRTPIARSNHLLKTSWLLKENISPIQILDNSKPDSMNTNNLQKQPDKIYNVKIKISSKDNNTTEELPNCKPSELTVNDQINNFSISNHINYWNSITSPQIVENDLLNKTTKEKQAGQKQFLKNCTIDKKHDSIDCMFNDNIDLLPIPINDLLNESFRKRFRNSNSSFEDSLWKREKMICENFDVYHNKNNSVKDTVNKFESFSNKSQKETNAKFYSNSLKQQQMLENGREQVVNHDESTTILEKENNFENSAKQSGITLKNNLENDMAKTTSMTFQLNSLQEYSPKKIYKSNLNILLLDNKNMETPDLTHKSKLIKLNLRNIDRRASDISWFCRNIRRDTEDENVRHSVCGTELLKQLGKFRQLDHEKLNEKFTTKYNKGETSNTNQLWPRDSFKLQVGKLTCWNCGCKVFAVNDREYENLESQNIINLPLPVTDMQISKSTEDLYIDDDFCQNILLGANMELETESDLYNFFDFN